jgi:hypothetical protein
MFIGLSRVLVAALEVAAVFTFWVLVFPATIMIVVLYLCRFIPLIGGRRKGRPR